MNLTSFDWNPVSGSRKNPESRKKTIPRIEAIVRMLGRSGGAAAFGESAGIEKS